ncbi:MAG: chemotaxis protein CheA [Deltaproteobacteria bacterium]|nr:chemotaxis protein CheA [Deltaproteobacteria bacterium]
MTGKDINSERFREFLAEADDILSTMGKALVDMNSSLKHGAPDRKTLHSIFRSAHTLKGMSGIYGLKDMECLSHGVEDVLEALRLGKIVLTEELVGLIMGAHGLLEKIVMAKGTSDNSSEVDDIKALLQRSSHGRPCLKAKKSPERFLSALTDYEEHRLHENMQQGRNLFIVNAVFNISDFDKKYSSLAEALGKDAEIIATLPTLPSSRRVSGDIAFSMLVGTAKDREFISGVAKAVTEADVTAPEELRLPSAHEAQPGLIAKNGWEEHSRAHGPARHTDTVRVSIHKLDSVMNTISVLGILRSGMARLSVELMHERSLSSYGIALSRMERQFEKRISELRDSVLDLRMVPIGQLFARFETNMARLESQSGRRVLTSWKGADTELDKLIIEKLSDPLMHIIRNAVDHAIEQPAVREAAGKPAEGSVTVSARQRGSHVLIEVRDDGVGMDEEDICRRAVGKGLLRPDAADRLSMQEKLGLIFLPGFSTKDAVTSSSGRGVGLDVVRENVARLNGVIDIDTVKGKGTAFIITIPSTLAIIQVVIVEDGLRRYAIPVSSIIEIVELGAAEALMIGADGEIDLNGRKMPTVRLSGFFGHGAEAQKPARYGIVAGLAEARLCVTVECLVEELDVVVKPLPSVITPPGIAGAADMGERGILLVIDVTGMQGGVHKGRHAASA